MAQTTVHCKDCERELTTVGPMFGHALGCPTFSRIDRYRFPSVNEELDLTPALEESLRVVNAGKQTASDATGEPMIEFSSGAKRSEKSLRYDLIPAEGLRRLAGRYTLGAAKYGDWNWQKGLKDVEYVNQFKAHMLAHWVAYLENGCKKDDNLAAIAWGAFALMEAEKSHE